MLRLNVYSLKQVRESGGLYDLPGKRIESPEKAYAIIESVLALGDLANEKFGILTLTTKNDVAGIHVLSEGSLNSSVVHPREVFKAAILNNAASIVCFHNHPSGDPLPSPQDIEINNRLVEAGTLLGIEVLDHVIIGYNCFCSMKERGFM